MFLIRFLDLFKWRLKEEELRELKLSSFLLTSERKLSASASHFTSDCPDYYSWCCEVSRNLDSMNKLCFIEYVADVEIPKVGEKFYGSWKRGNSTVRYWLLNSLELTKLSVMWMKTAKEVWIDLQQRYSRGDAEWTFSAISHSYTR